jgi:hypothetical protein
MFTTHVALVPYEEGLVPADELLYVAAALQTQVVRDLGPLWGVSGYVSPFLRLRDVPPVYVPVVVAPRLGQPWHGFHMVADGRPLALIGYRKGWSLLASHELMELLCDPWGTRTHQGRSLKTDQGHVEYLVEVCDPCQDEHYMIHDIHVSDFVTPAFYGPRAARGDRYSFTGTIERPLEVTKRGLVSWRTPDGQIWQKSGDDEPKQLEADTFSRASLSRDADDGGLDITDNLSEPRTRKPYYRLDRSDQRYGQGLKASVDVILEQLGAKAPKANLKNIVRLLEELAKDDSPLRAEFEASPEKTLKKYGLDPPANIKKLRLAPAETYRGVLAALYGGQGLGDPKLGTWLSAYGVFASAGIE